jgi:hypothetical protein
MKIHVVNLELYNYVKCVGLKLYFYMDINFTLICILILETFRFYFVLFVHFSVGHKT